MLDIFRNICSVSVLTFIGQIWLVSVGTHKLLILPFFIDTSQNRHGLLMDEINKIWELRCPPEIVQDTPIYSGALITNIDASEVVYC